MKDRTILSEAEFMRTAIMVESCMLIISRLTNPVKAPEYMAIAKRSLLNLELKTGSDYKDYIWAVRNIINNAELTLEACLK